MNICVKCKTKYSDSLMHCPNCGSMDTKNNPFGFHDGNLSNNVIKVVIYGLLRFFAIAVPLVLIAWLSGKIMGLINVRENSDYEVNLYNNYVLLNQYCHEMDLYYQAKNWDALVELNNSYYDMFTLWEHNDIFNIIMEVKHFKDLVDEHELTLDNYSYYDYTIAYMLELRYLENDNYSLALADDELIILNELKDILDDLFHQAGLDKYDLENIALSCNEDGTVDNYCLLERIGE